jgi:NAD(P)-dependent dehydrogenase (short-subunit alcohol dehydrogenase family)
VTSTALVTGAGAGMGAAVARKLAADGYRVVCADLNEAAAQETAAGLPDAEAIAVDVSDQASVRAAVAACGPELRAVVNSAGILSYAPVLKLSLEDFDRVVKVNLRGTFIVLQEAGTVLAANGGGAIVVFASIESFRTVTGHAHYSASKAGVLLLTQAFADELGPSGVRVNAVAPGAIRTAMTAKALDREDTARHIAASVPLGRPGEPDEVAGVCAFLCSETASYVTGVCWRVDGGTLIKTPM